MSYYFTKTLKVGFGAAKEAVVEALGKEGFGVLTEIDVQATLKKKLNVDLYRYEILGACNPTMAHQALLAEDKIGTMLPCNVILQQKTEGGPIEVTAVDPVASMASVRNETLGAVARQVQAKFKHVIDSL